MIYTFPMSNGCFPDLGIDAGPDPQGTLMSEITYRIMKGIPIPYPKVYNNSVQISIYLQDQILSVLKNRLQGG